jgi:branched-chain amino acid transport system ATP-binding protein
MWFSIEDLWVYYGKVAAIRGVRMEVAQGEVVTLIGPNGAGKTTLMRTVSGLKKPTKGIIGFQDERIEGRRPEAIVARGIAHVPEGRRVFPFLSVLDNLMLGAYARKDRETITGDLNLVFERFPRLKERSRQIGGTLSGGEQQMLAIGRALMSKPALLLLDEPSLGLAPLIVAAVSKIIREINANGVAIVLVEQNAKMALKVAKRGYVMTTGAIVLNGDTNDLVKNEEVRKAYLGL